MQKEKKHIIKRLLELEKNLSRLYSLYAGVFPERASFWQEISFDEEKHAESLKTFRKLEQEGTLRFEKGRVHADALELTIKKLKTHLKTVRHEYRKRLKQPSQRTGLLKEAVRKSLNFESDIAEQDYYKVFGSDNLALKKVFYRLGTDAKDHKRKVKNLYTQISR